MERLEKSRLELDKARAALASMKQAYATPPIDVDAYEEAWLTFLHAIERVWYKCLSQSKAYQKRHVCIGEWETLRKKDSLLSFLTKSRGAEEHSHLEVTARQFGIREITKVHGPMAYSEIDGALVPALVVGESYTVHLDPETVKLKPVEYRGQKYDVPTTHCGKRIPNPTPITLAELAIAFYERMLQEIEQCLFCSAG